MCLGAFFLIPKLYLITMTLRLKVKYNLSCGFFEQPHEIVEQPQEITSIHLYQLFAIKVVLVYVVKCV